MGGRRDRDAEAQNSALHELFRADLALAEYQALKAWEGRYIYHSASVILSSALPNPTDPVNTKECNRSYSHHVIHVRRGFRRAKLSYEVPEML